MKIKSVAKRYDIEWKGLYEDLEFFKKCAKEHGGSILELAAGTGRVAFELAKQGHDVWALDIDNEMLDVFRSKIASNNSKDCLKEMGKIKLIQGDMADYSLDKKFNLVIMPGNSFITQITQEKQLATLKRIREHLSDGGVAILPIVSASRAFEKADLLRFRYTFRDDEENLTYHKYSRIDMCLPLQQIVYHYYYDIVGDDGSTTRIHSEVETRMVFRYEMELLLKTAGLKISEVLGSYDGTKIGPKSPWMIFIVSKDDEENR
jgi:ubiquinone/menaquinone biosynthesis C-methylase UbiE